MAVVLPDPPPLTGESSENDRESYAWYRNLVGFLREDGGLNTRVSALEAGLVTDNIGSVGANTSAAEYGDAYQHTTVVTFSQLELSPTIPANAEGAGAIVYTFPAGVFMVTAVHMDITSGVMDSATNAADVGIGSLIASGNISTLTPASMEDYMTGQTVADVSSFVVEKSTTRVAGAPLLFEAGDSHTMNINVAATWNNTVATASVTGTITFNWIFLGA